MSATVSNVRHRPAWLAAARYVPTSRPNAFAVQLGERVDLLATTRFADDLATWPSN
jgi:hypothetical protein